MNKDDLKELGFKPITTFTVADNLIFDLGRNRQLSISNVGTPNEMLYICQIETEAGGIRITDLICLHNYYYDGYLSTDILKMLISCLGTATTVESTSAKKPNFTIEFTELQPPQMAIMKEWANRVNAKEDTGLPKLSMAANGDMNIVVKNTDQMNEILEHLKINGFKIMRPDGGNS